MDFNHGLNAAVNKLRETLSDSAEEPKYIETLPRRGYRFIGTIENAVGEVKPATTMVPVNPQLVPPPTPVMALAQTASTARHGREILYDQAEQDERSVVLVQARS